MIVGCTRGTRVWPPGYRIICAKHWKQVPVRLKRHRQKMRRYLIKAKEWEALPDDKYGAPTSDRGRRIMANCWKRIEESLYP